MLGGVQAINYRLRPRVNSTKYKEAVYSDCNGNCEKVWTKAGSTTSPVTGSPKIPAGATLGVTRLSVRKCFDCGNAEATDFRFFDMSGKLLQSGQTAGQKVNVTNLPKGVYLIQIGNTSKKLVK